MSNTFFQFKQFRIDQPRAAMKVTTEACILGGLAGNGCQAVRILDIGTGTGLLALMLAQKFQDAQVDAVELIPEAMEQAQENIHASPWADRIQIHHSAIQNFKPEQQYDLIVSNPPFYNRSLRSPINERNDAKHDEHLSQKDMAEAIGKLLAADGVCFVLYPPAEADRFIKVAEAYDLYPGQIVVLYNQPKDIGKYPFRKILRLSKNRVNPDEKILVIRDTDGQYTEDFKALLKDYYLAL